MSSKWQIHKLTVEHVGADRLDLFLASSDHGISRSRAKKIIDIGGVHLNGRRVRSCSQAVSPGDSIEVFIDQYPLDPFRLSADHILYQDKFLIVVNKPPYIDTQPTHARYKGTLYEALQVYLQDPFRPRLKPEIGMIQRLDRGTSGIIAFSTHQRAHKEMTALFVEHRVDKRYLALVKGRFSEQQGEIRSLLARSRQQNRVQSVARGGKEAITRYQVVEQFSDAALVEVELLTGRSHQIRAHMSELGHPLLGDVKYGGPKLLDSFALNRPMLHASRLSFKHPVTGSALAFEVDPPEDMQDLLTFLREERQ